jgi:hypothetical protein
MYSARAYSLLQDAGWFTDVNGNGQALIYGYTMRPNSGSTPPTSSFIDVSARSKADPWVTAARVTGGSIVSGSLYFGVSKGVKTTAGVIMLIAGIAFTVLPIVCCVVLFKFCAHRRKYKAGHGFGVPVTTVVTTVHGPPMPMMGGVGPTGSYAYVPVASAPAHQPGTPTGYGGYNYQQQQQQPYMQQNSDFPSGNYPPGNYPAGNYPAGNYPAGNYPPGNYPAGNYPAGNYPTGNYAATGYASPSVDAPPAKTL